MYHIDKDISHNLTRDQISVCICTYLRPEMLSRTLQGVNCQTADDNYSFEVVVVDNDSGRSAEAVVKQFEENTKRTIVYDCEPVQNIALARNRAVRNATGNLIAFIDDDEAPVKDWLHKLYCTMQKSNADGVLGPVLPEYPAGAPGWLQKGNIFDRRRFLTGTQLTVRYTRTGNVLLSRALLANGSMWFNPDYGRTGGEDVEFFRRHLAMGHSFVWCDEAVVYEMIPAERWRTSFHLKKHFRIGTLNGEWLRKSGRYGLKGILKCICAVPVWLVMLIASLPFGKHVWFRPVLRIAYSGGCLLAYGGISLMRLRE